MTHPMNVGALVQGAPTSRRVLCQHAELLNAYTDGEFEDGAEAYLSHYCFGPEMQTHQKANWGSVAGYTGATWCKWLVFDIDKPNLGDALTDVRKLVAYLHDRYPELEDAIPIYFSGSKGFHVLLPLVNSPAPSTTFHHVAKAFCTALAADAGVTIDTSIYDIAHIIRLPNTKHPKTGLFKRRLDFEELVMLDADGVRRVSRHPSGDGLPAAEAVSVNLAFDWSEAEQIAREKSAAHAARLAENLSPDLRAPRFFMELMRFGVGQGERHLVLFRASAWLTEQGAPPSLSHALLTEAGCDVGLSPADVARQIDCGIRHARKQSEGGPAA